MMRKPKPILGSWLISSHVIVWCFGFAAALAATVCCLCGWAEERNDPVAFIFLLMFALGITGMLALPIACVKLGDNLKAGQYIIAIKALGVTILACISTGYCIFLVAQLLRL